MLLRHLLRPSGLLVLVAAPDGRARGHVQVVAIDRRGYNLSDKPNGVESYDRRLLVGDVAAVIRHLYTDFGHASTDRQDLAARFLWQAGSARHRVLEMSNADANTRSQHAARLQAGWTNRQPFRGTVSIYFLPSGADVSC